MHKHHRKTTGGYRSRSRNANDRLPPAASEFIENLLGGLGESDDPAVAYLRDEYLSKFNDESLTPAAVRREAAVDKWIATEITNRSTNASLRDRDYGWNILPRVTWKSFLTFARRLTSEVLGPLRDEVVLGTFSGGASTSRRRTESHPAQKFTGEADVTSEASAYIDIIYRLSPLLGRYQPFTYPLREVEGAVLFTVPKKTDIDRCACKEPDINMFLQKGVGRHIRGRLRRFGINLNDQSINRRLARVGSIDGSLATLDLSSASDTITIEAVRSLLPDEWFLYLNDIRSSSVWVDQELHRTEMFSSMGNGFTFELESLIFYVLMRTVSYFKAVPGIISVYGDDIIIPTELYDDASWVLKAFGFSVNPDKSFHTGPFRESCGGHYLNGVDVTPFYLKRKATHLTDAIRVANQLRRWAFADPARQYMVPTTYKVWSQLASYIPKSLWGGYDVQRDTQLVAPVPPKKQLVRFSGNKDLDQKGAYLYWHNTNWNRSIDPEDGFEPVSTENRCRLRAAMSGAPITQEWFYEELFPESDPR